MSDSVNRFGKRTGSKSPVAYIISWAGKKKIYYVLSVTFAIISVISKVFPFVVIADVINKLMESEKSIQVYLIRVGIILGSFIIGEFMHMVSTSLSHEATFHVLSSVRKEVTDKLVRLPLGYIKDQPSGAFKNVIVERLDSIETVMAHVIPEVTSGLLIPILMFVYFFIIDWRVALWSFLPVLVGGIFFLMMAGTTGRFYPRTIKAAKNLNATAVEYINGIEVIKAFSKTKGSYEKFKDAALENANANIDWMRYALFYQTVALNVMPYPLLAVLPAGAIYVSAGTLSIPNYVMCIIICLGCMGPIVTMAAYMDDIARAGTIIGEVTTILEEPELVRPAVSKAEPKDNGIELQNVHFAYKEKEVLHGVDLTIRPGTFNALVGPSGSGKSTIAKLIASFWDPTEGKILIGGVDERDLALAEYNKRIAYVSQDNYLFDMTVRENIRMGNPDATDEEVEEIARKSGCYDFIMGLEDGFETVAGGQGGHLSGGERQRISIARAMLKDAPIIILDEATAYTDPENEALIQRSIAGLVQGKTLLVIAHRLSTIKEADCIFVVNNGNIEASGTQEELLESCPLYKSMWEAHIASRDAAEPAEGAGDDLNGEVAFNV